MLHPFKHFCTITKHRHAVIRMCFKAGIPWRGLLHDLSKYSPTEFWAGARYWQGGKSPNELERREKGCSAAWLHHKGRNKHHFEYWTDYVKGQNGLCGIKMPAVYLVEMFCDRVAACKVYYRENYTDSSALEYYVRSVHSYVMHPDTSAALKQMLEILSEQGEDAVFRFIRSSVLGGGAGGQ